MAVSQGRIPETAFKAVSGIFFGIAIVAAALRALIHLRMRMPLRLDDYLLLFACILLTTGTALLYYGTSSIYLVTAFQESLATAPGTAVPGSAPTEADYGQLEAILKETVFFEKLIWAYLAVSWAAIFAVKFAFLSFFRHLVNRLPRLHLYWKVVVVLVALAFTFAVCTPFIACLNTDSASLTCAQGKRKERALAIGSWEIILDIITDILILFIPVTLLWRVQMKTRQKLGLGAFLCLSIFMCITAAIRAAGLHYQPIFDGTWLYLWQQVEACVAVTMISLTGFRSAFVHHVRVKNQPSPWQASTARILRKRKKLWAEHQELANVTIPSATLTGMRTAIRGDQTETLKSGDETLVPDCWFRGEQSNWVYRQAHPPPV